MSEPQPGPGLTRREVIKRGVILGGTVMWVTPVVQSVGMNRAQAQEPSDTCIERNAVAPVQATPGTGTSGNPDHVRVADGNTYTLGHRGMVWAKLEGPVYPHTGATAVVLETGGSTVDERGQVEVSQNGTDWHHVGSFDQSDEFNFIAVPASLPIMYFEYLRVVDDSEVGSNGVDVNYMATGCA